MTAAPYPMMGAGVMPPNQPAMMDPMAAFGMPYQNGANAAAAAANYPFYPQYPYR